MPTDAQSDIAPLFLTVNATARAMAVSRASVYRSIARGELSLVPIFGDTGPRRIPFSQVQALAEQQIAATLAKKKAG